MKLLTTLANFLKSRDKILSKRRTINLKNRPMSKKSLQQQRAVMNIAYETKLVQIKKQMDRKKSQNHHINQIVQDLFYPQIQLSNQEEVNLRAKQTTNDATSMGDQWEQLVKMDHLEQELRQNSLPLQLLEFHQQKYAQFNHKHYLMLLDRLGYYCVNKNRLQQQRLKKWQSLLSKMKSSDPKVKQQAKCPYLFLQRQEIPRHQYWLNLVQQIRLKMQSQSNLQQFNQYLPVLLFIRKIFYHVPGQLYQLALNRNSSAPFDKLRQKDISLLIQLLKFRNKIRFNPTIKINTPEGDMPKEYNHIYFARKLANEVIQHPQKYTIQDLGNLFKVINSRKRRMNIISQQQFPKIQKIVETFLNDLPFQNVETLFSIYCTFNQNPNFQFIQIIKFDLFRKAQHCREYFYLLDLINKIKARELVFNVYQPKGIEPKKLKFESYQLLLKLGQVITKKLGLMKSYELIQILDAYYDSDIKDLSLLQILSTQIVKKGSQFTLQILGKSFFKLTLLNYRSKMLTKYVFQQYSQRYHSDLKKYKEEGVFFFPTQQKVQQLPLDFKQIYLQECLLMILWSTCTQMGENLSANINLQEMLHLIPVKMQSADPLAIELAININTALKPLSFFPKITYQNSTILNFPQGRLRQFYQHEFSMNMTELLMKEQAEKSQLFVANFNRMANKFLKEKWSHQSVYSQNQYLSFCLEKINSNSTEKGNCFYDKQVILSEAFLKKRAQFVVKILKKHQTDSKETSQPTQQPKRKYKLYDLLV